MSKPSKQVKVDDVTYLITAPVEDLVEDGVFEGIPPADIIQFTNLRNIIQRCPLSPQESKALVKEMRRYIKEKAE